MIFLKFVSGIVLLIAGILLVKYQRKYPVSEDSYDDELIKKSGDFQGYLLSFILICTGIGLIISVFV